MTQENQITITAEDVEKSRALIEGMKATTSTLVEGLSVGGVQLTKIRDDFRKSYEALCRANPETMDPLTVLEFSHAVVEMSKHVAQVLEAIQQISNATTQLVRGCDDIP